MTDQQERITVEILETMRSIHSTSHDGLVNILSHLVDETFQLDENYGKCRVTMSSYRVNGESKKIHAIKILREHSEMGLKDVKEIVDKLDNVGTSIVFIDNINYEMASKIVNELSNIGLVGNIEKL